MEDVARLAGVSMVTVSRALNTPDKVAPATRARIEEAVQRIGYVPNLLAGSLASNRSRIVAALVPTIANSIFSETVEGMSEVLTRHGYQLLLGQTGYDESIEEALVATFLGRRVDGILLTGIGHSRDTRLQLMRRRLPVVETWDLTPSPIDRIVGFSNREAGEAMTRYLIERGYRRIGFAGGADERSESRRAGWLAAHAAAGRPSGPSLAVATPSRVAAGREAIDELMRHDPPPDAVFFSNDVLAIGAMLQCQRRGWPVPGQVAVAGFTDTELASEFNPSLTTVHVRGRAIGERAAEVLLARIDGRGDVQRAIDVGYEIVARDSA